MQKHNNLSYTAVDQGKSKIAYPGALDVVLPFVPEHRLSCCIGFLRAIRPRTLL